MDGYGSDEFSFWVLTNLAGQPNPPPSHVLLPLPEIAGVPYDQGLWKTHKGFP